MIPDKKLRIKEWALEDRPREKMLRKGVRNLSDAELIAILIRIGNLEDTAVELAKKILKAHQNDLNNLARMGIADLTRFKGIGEAKAIHIIAALELGRRRKQIESTKNPVIKSSADSALFFQSLLGDLQHEEFWVMFLDRSNKSKMQYQISQGGISGTVIDVRLILKKGIELLASSLILAHNHPSGNLTPSDGDISITKKIKEAGKIMDISVVDHLIVSNNGYYSFADNGLL